MPNGFLYKWEDHNRGLDHKCGTCATPLSSSRAKKSCFGKHEMVCKRFHKTLFYPGKTNSCYPCHQTDELHIKRHREIIMLIRHIGAHDKSVIGAYPISGKKKPRRAAVFSSSCTVRDPEENLMQRGSEEWNDSSTLVEDESDWKGSAMPDLTEALANGDSEQAANRTPAKHQGEIETITKLEFQRIDIVLHPFSSSRAAKHQEDRLLGLEQDTMEENIPYHPNTFKYSKGHGRRESKANTRHQFGGLPEDPEQRTALINSILEKLGIDQTLKRAAKGRKAMAKLKIAISEDTESAANEEAERMQRMAGYWRYANRRTYNRMVRLNEVWDWSTGAKLPEIDEETDDGESSECEGDGTLSGSTEIGSSGPTSPAREINNNMDDLKLEDSSVPSLGAGKCDITSRSTTELSENSEISRSGISGNKSSESFAFINPGQQPELTLTNSNPSSSSDGCILDGLDLNLGRNAGEVKPLNELDCPIFKDPWSTSIAITSTAEGKKHQADDSSDHLPPDAKTLLVSGENKPPSHHDRSHRAFSLPARGAPKSNDKNNRYKGLEIELPAPREDDELSPPQTACLVPPTLGISASVSGERPPSGVHDSNGFPAVSTHARSASPIEPPPKPKSISISVTTAELLRAKEDAYRNKRKGKGKKGVSGGDMKSNAGTQGNGEEGEWTTV